MVFSLPCFAERPFTIYAKDNLPPTNFLDGGFLKGLSIDIVNEIQRRTGTNEPIHAVPWARGNEMVKSRKKTILLTYTPTDDRKIIYYLGPIASTDVALFAKEDFNQEIKNLDDVINEKVAVRDGTHPSRILKKLKFKKIELTNTIQQNHQMVLSGRAKFLAEVSLQAQGTFELLGLKPLKKVFVLEKMNIYIAFSKDTPAEILNAWKKALSDMKEDGTFNKIHKKWIPNSPPPMNTELFAS